MAQSGYWRMPIPCGSSFARATGVIPAMIALPVRRALVALRPDDWRT